MMEALDQQQAKLSSNRVDGEAGTGSETGTGGGGGVAGEEDDFEELHLALGLAEEKSETQQGENNNAQEKGEGKRKKSKDDVIDLTLANGQDCQDTPEEADTEPVEESPIYAREDTNTSEKEAFLLVPAVSPPNVDLVKRELVEDDPEELQERSGIPIDVNFFDNIKLKTEVDDKADSLSDNEMEFLSDIEEQPVESPEAKHVSSATETADRFMPKEEVEEKYFPSANEDSESENEEKVYTPPVIDLETDSESGEKEFLSIKDHKSPVFENNEVKAESESPKDLYKDAVSEDIPTTEPEVDETPLQLAADFPLEESDTVDSPSLTMDVDLPSSEYGDAPPNIIKIESDSEDEVVSSDSIKLKEHNVEIVPLIKLNGAHESLKEEKLEEEGKVEHDNEPEEPKQMSVIRNHTGDNTNVENTTASQEPPLSLILPLRTSRSRSTSSRSSTVSSASQPQLVIDHPESEHNARVQTIKLSQKRRRSESSSVSQSEKQAKVEGDGSSLLLQRLQGNPNVGPSVAPVKSQFLSCAKCNLQFEFESFQQLNEHQAQCTGIRSVSIGSSQLLQKKERFFRCAQCSSVHQCWHFFLHMREVHQRYICLFCNHVYPSVEKLSLHLENKHDIDQSHFAKDAWALNQKTEDRARHLVCCTCQATFVQGSEFEDHDCSQLMQPCALCSQKGCHAIGCKNNKRKPVKKRRKARKPPELSVPPVQPVLPVPPVLHLLPVPAAQEVVDPTMEVIPEQPQLQVQPEPQILLPAENIPAPEPIEEPPAPPIPKLVVPKIMLRVPKEFQKSVDAALSSTDTEDEELETTQPVEEVATAPPEELPFEAPPPPPPALSFDDSTSSKLNRVLAELERTKLDIERTKADIITKKQSKIIMAHAMVENVAPQLIDHPQQLQPQPEEQRRWSLTPPASPHNNHVNLPEPPPDVITEFQDQPDAVRRNSLGSDCMDIDDSLNGPEMEDSRDDHPDDQQRTVEAEQPLQESRHDSEQIIMQPLPPADGIMVAAADTPTVDLQLDRPLDKFPMVDFIRLCLKSVYSECLYCNHARRIAVNGKQLVLHLIRKHRFTATVDSITAEELHAETIVARLKSFLPHLENEYMNAASFCSLENGKYVEPFNERIYECFTCRFVTSTHKELYTHNRRMHIKSNITCTMCQTNFYSYSEILCHICPGEVAGSVYDLQFRCCLCEMAPLPSAFRLMVHLRKQHQACDICLEDCQSQAKLSSHVWKHKLLHLCYRCGIAYRNKQDISKHLFWKHGTESASCKQCQQKRWRHVYHFCVPPGQFPCEQCGFIFSKAIYLEVHQRMHSGDFRYACTEEGCEEKFVSRKLLLKHASNHVIKELLPAPSQEPANDTITPENLEEIKQEVNEEEETKNRNQNGEKLLSESENNTESTKKEESDNKESIKEQTGSKSESRKRRKKSKRNKESLEDLNLIAPNLSESDSSDDSDSDAARSSHQEQPVLPMRSSVDDLDMPKVMLSPSSESDADDLEGKPKLEKKEKSLEATSEEKELDASKADEESDPKKDVEQVDVSIWKNLLQNQSINPEDQAVKEEKSVDDQPPAKLHVAWSDHDYCKLHRTPPPSPVKPKSITKSLTKTPGQNASSDSDSSSSSSSSDSDSSSCSCGSNCSCSSSNSSSSSDDSDDSDSSNARGSPQKRARKKSLKLKKSSESLKNGQQNDQNLEEDVNVTAVNENNITASPPSPKPPMYNESDFDTAFSDTDEEFYDSHPQKLANELLAQKREALMAEHAPLRPSNNYDIVENSRPSTPSLPEEASAFADKRERVRNKKKKRERKSTCKSGKLPPMASTPLPTERLPGMAAMSGIIPPLEPPTPIPSHQESSLFPVTPLTHRHLQSSLTRMSEGSSCSDADGQLKRSKRQRRPNKFYGYTSDDENMSTILAPPLQVGMQLIKPQPPPQLTWAKEDLPTPPKQRNRNNNNNSHHHHSHSNGGTSLSGSSRKRSKQRSLLGAGGSRSAKRHKPDREDHLPPIPTLKIRPSLLPTTAPPTDSSDSSSDEEDTEVNVTSLVATPQPAPPPVLPPPLSVALPVQPPPPPPPAATAFNQPIPPALLPNPGFATLQYFKANNIRYPIRPPAGARLAREGESVYCYCRCPYDEVSEMIACDGDNCLIEWFHFECVGIMVAPQGKWFCAECRPKYSEGIYQGAKA